MPSKAASNPAATPSRATDNLNRVAADIRLISSKNGGGGTTPGSVSYQFDRKG